MFVKNLFSGLGLVVFTPRRSLALAYVCAPLAPRSVILILKKVKTLFVNNPVDNL